MHNLKEWRSKASRRLQVWAAQDVSVWRELWRNGCFSLLSSALLEVLSSTKLQTTLLTPCLPVLVGHPVQIIGAGKRLVQWEFLQISVWLLSLKTWDQHVTSSRITFHPVSAAVYCLCKGGQLWEQCDFSFSLYMHLAVLHLKSRSKTCTSCGIHGQGNKGKGLNCITSKCVSTSPFLLVSLSV